MWRSRLTTVIEEPAESIAMRKSIEDFILPRPIGRKGSAQYIYERGTYVPHILQSCSRQDWTDPRSLLVKIATESKFFVPTHFVFPHESQVCVGSHIADMCLADIIWGSISLTEEHASAILTQVVQALYEITRSGISYNNLEASRIFVSKEGVVQLANFGSTLEPRWLKESTNNPDCIALVHLANKILSRSNLVQQSAVLRQKKIRMKLGGDVIYVDPGFSGELLDFFKACDENDMGRLLKHKFLGVSGACLSPLVYNALLEADRT